MENSKGSDEESSSPRPALLPLSIARTVWKRKAIILSVWVLLTASTAAVIHRLPSVYSAESVILVDSQKIPEKFVSATVASDLENRIAAIREQILSSGELKNIIDEFGLYTKQRKNHFQEEILAMMRDDISISIEPVAKDNKQPGAFRVGYQGPDPTVVTRVANRLTDLFVEGNLKTREGQAEGTSEFLDAQLRAAKGRLDELEAAVSSYKLKHNGELPEQQQAIEGILSRLQVELETNRDAINRAQQTKVILSSSLSAMEARLASETRPVDPGLGAGGGAQPAAAGAPAAAPTRKRSEVLQEQLDLLRTRYSDNHPDVIHVRAQLEEAKRAEAREESAALSSPPSKPAPPGKQVPHVRRPAPVAESPELSRIREQVLTLSAQLTGTDKELADRSAEQQRILRDIAMYQARNEQLPVREQQMAQLTRDYDMSKENYKSLLDKKMAADMALDMEVRQKAERFTVLDRAKVPSKPIKPKRPVLYGGGIAAGLAIALLAGVVLELRRNVFLGEWELPDGTSILARLPYIEVPISSHVARPGQQRLDHV